MGCTLKAEPEDFYVEELPQPWVINGSKGSYTYFRLTKRDMTTEQAVRRVARHVGRERKLFGYAGIKDRRAITVQYCSVRGPMHAFESGSLKVEPVGAGNEPISLGDLIGNRFRIRVRDSHGAPHEIPAIPNYYDEQRFGALGNNVQIGEAVIAGDFKRVVELAMGQSAGFAVIAKTHLETRGNDWVGALRLLPKKIALLYLHSYQSLLYNRLLDRLIRESGCEIREIEIRPHGAFAVPKRVPPSLQEAKLPVCGFGTDLDAEPAEVRLIARELLGERSPRDFLIRQMPELSAEGGQRKAFVQPEAFSAKDEGEGSYLLEFSLPPGSYATIVAKALYCP